MKSNKRVLLITESMMHYRISLYDKFTEYFKMKGYNLLLYSNQEINKFDNSSLDYFNGDYSIKSLVRIVKKTNPSHIIFFWNIYNLNSWAFILWCKINRLDFIYWSHGMSLQDPNNKLKKKIYNIFQYLSDAIILYSENELKFIPDRLKQKTFIANNTINFTDIPKIELSNKEIKKELKLSFKKIVLFVGRIQKRKRLDVLIKIFINRKDHDIGLVIAGPDIPKEYIDVIKKKKNIVYLGAVYNTLKINKLFKCSDLFCIPGTNGLGINQAMYWGLPVLALNVNHSPEIYYVKNGLNGFILDSEEELEEKIFHILNNDVLLEELSNNASKIIRKEGIPEVMIKGFFNAINYVNRSNDL